MQQKFLRNLAFLLGLNLLVKPFWILGITVMVQNAVGPTEFGTYFSLLNFGYLFFIILDAGLNNYTNKQVAQDNYFVKNHFVTISGVKLLLGIIYLAVLMILGIWVMKYPSHYLDLLWIIALNLFLSSALMFLRSNLAGLHLFKWDSVASVLDRILMIVICGALLWSEPNEAGFSIFHFAWAQTIAYALTIVYAVMVMAGKTVKIKWTIKKGLLKKVVRQSYPFALLTLLMSFYTRIDSVMIERLLPNGTTEAGIYAQGYKVYEAANMFAFLFATLLLPVFSKLIANRESVRPIVDWTVRLLLIPAVIISIWSWFYGGELIDLLYKAELEKTASIFPVLMIAFIAMAANYIYGTLLTAQGKMKLLNLLSLAGIVVNVILNWFLIHSYGALGAAWATAFTQSGVAISQFVAANKFNDLRIHKKDLLKSLGLIIFMAGLIYLEKQTQIPKYAGVFAIPVLTITGAFLLKLIRLKDLFNLLKYRA
ncbi:flippase [Salibacter halophilus]|uniref:flippase n=1 Tax=Salibacter halophilus TaxID=1803916 RepID=UPI0014784B12|nr:flippase [Salibacter halophilus]